jgi:hypothetical protein
MKNVKKLWIALGALALLTPLGLLASGTAWGEWGSDELSTMLGYVPAGMARFSELWHAPLPDYTIPGLGDTPGYVLSAVVGIALIALVTYGLGKLLASGER